METGKAKYDPEKYLWGDFKKMKLTWERPREKLKRDIHGGKGVAALS